jgi:transposase
MATEANLQELRRTKRSYLCGSRRAVVRQHLPVIRVGPWTVVRPSATEQPTIEVQELPSTTATDEPTERWLLCRSAGCRLKEQQIYDARLAKARQRLAKLQQQVAVGTFTTAHVILAKARKAVGRTHDLQGIFTFALSRADDGQQLQIVESASAIQDERDLQGVYLLRTTVPALAADDLWHMYMLLTRVEAAFRNLKTDLSIRPIYHHKENRGDAHVLFSVLAYALSVTIQLRYRQHGTDQNLTTPALLETLQAVQLAELSYQTSDGSRLCFERASVPSAAQQAILTALGWTIPARYLPPNLEAEPRRVV